MKKTGKKPKNPHIAVRMLPKKLSAMRCEEPAAGGEPDAGEVDGAETGPEQEQRQAARRKALRATATAIVVGAAFEAAVPTDLRRRLRHGQALAAVVLVPDGAWVAPAVAYVRSAYGERWSMYARDGADRKRNASFGNDDVARDLSKGLCVMGIAPDLGLIPEALKSAADVTIRISPPDGAVLRKAIARFARRSPGELEAGIAAGLGLHQIVAAFRPGTGAKEIARRLAAARRAGADAGPTDRVPDLAAAVEYGEAREWGLKLARDVADFRAGKLAWRDVDRGICLHSPPGMGKTLFARILAKACGVALVTTSVGAWFANGPGYLDSVVKEMRAAFARAAALASPCCILFLDEIDALPDRATLSPRGRDWWIPIITDALTLLDSAVNDRTGIVVVGATNAIERVDDALLRPGRLEKAVEIPRPDATGALNIVRFHLDGEIEGDLSALGPLLAGRTGAEIMHAVRTARRAARHAGRALALDDLERAALPAPEIDPALLFRMSVHEAAHAVASLALGVGVLRRAVLGVNGASGGHTALDFDRGALSTLRDIEDRVVVGLAGRAAERAFIGCVSTGSGGIAGSDIGSATALIAAVHGSFAMGENLAFLADAEELQREMMLNASLRDRVERHLRELDARATRLVEANREAIVAVAERLAEKRFLSGDEIGDIVRGRLVAVGRRRPREEDGC